MRKFLRNTVIALLLFGGVAVLLDVAITWRSHGKQYERYADFNVMKAGVNAEVVVLGNSRARYHFDTRVMEDRLGRKCYNTGMIGYPIMDQLEKLRYYLKYNRTPALVIVNMDAASWEPLERDTIGQYEQFLDDIRDPIVLGIVQDKIGFRYADLLPWARFSGYPTYVGKIAIDQTMDSCWGGYASDPTVMPEAALAQVIPPYDHQRVLFKAYIDAIRAHRAMHWPKARIVYVESPYFQRDSTVVLPHLLDRLDPAYESALALDLSWVGDTALFMNRTHLNSAGAAYYCRLLCDSFALKQF